MPIPASFLTTALQVLAIILVSLVVGTVFGIWRGYDPVGYSPSTYVEVQKGAVRGLNLLIPLLGMGALAAVAVLAILARTRTDVLGLYVLAIIALGVAGLVTRFGNQPINDQIMDWVATDLPKNWMGLRDQWWTLHEIRLAASFVGEVLLIGAVFADRA